jgi:hypothetical protein
MTNFLTVSEIEELAESLVRKFLAGRQKMPQAVDIDSFATDFLKLPVEYHAFAEADNGKIGFISDGRTALRIYQSGIRTVVFPRGTIILEKSLRRPQEKNRRRFTLAHEVSHYLVDRTICTASFHREYDSERAYSVQDFRELFSFQENKIDRLAAAVLMPRFMVLNTVDWLTGGRPISIYGDCLISLEDKLLVRKMAETMAVSYTAFLIRLKQLRLYTSRSADEFITEQMCLGNEVMF